MARRTDRLYIKLNSTDQDMIRYQARQRHQTSTTEHNTASILPSLRHTPIIMYNDIFRCSCHAMRAPLRHVSAYTLCYAATICHVTTDFPPTEWWRTEGGGSGSGGERIWSRQAGRWQAGRQAGDISRLPSFFDHHSRRFTICRYVLRRYLRVTPTFSSPPLRRRRFRCRAAIY